MEVAQELLHASSKREEVRDCLNISTNYREFLHHWDNFELSYSTGYEPTEKLYERLMHEYTFEKDIQLEHWSKVCERIVARKQYEKINGSVCDLYSASLATQILAKLSPQNKEKLLAMPWQKAISICYKLLGKSR